MGARVAPEVGVAEPTRDREDVGQVCKTPLEAHEVEAESETPVPKGLHELVALPEKLWRIFCPLLGAADMATDPRYATNSA